MTTGSCLQHIRTSDAYVVVWLEVAFHLRNLRASMATPKGKRPSSGDPAAKAAASANVGGNAASGSEIAAAESLDSTKKPRIAIEEMCGSVPCMPDLPGSHMHANTYMLMRQVVSFVMHALPGALDGLHIEHEKDSVACPPIRITASEKVGVLRSFKEVWGPQIA